MTVRVGPVDPASAAAGTTFAMRESFASGPHDGDFCCGDLDELSHAGLLIFHQDRSDVNSPARMREPLPRVRAVPKTAASNGTSRVLDFEDSPIARKARSA
jgi:hypothetical protein